MDHGQMTTITGSVEGRCGLRDVLPNDRRVADLAIAEPQLVVCEPYGAGIVRALGLRESLDQKRNATGGFTAGRRQPPVHPPQLGQSGRLQTLARFGRTAKRLGRLSQVVLEEPGLGEGAAD